MNDNSLLATEQELLGTSRAEVMTSTAGKEEDRKLCVAHSTLLRSFRFYLLKLSSDVQVALGAHPAMALCLFWVKEICATEDLRGSVSARQVCVACCSPSLLH